MDVRMPVLNGIDATAAITRKHPGVKVLVLTTYDQDDYAFGALGAGASGYLLKDAEPGALISAIHAAASGLFVFSEIILEMLFDNRPAEPSQVDELTSGEQDALHLLSLGKSNREIAEALHLSESSVKARLSSAASKLGSSSRTGTVARAKDLGIV